MAQRRSASRQETAYTDTVAAFIQARRAAHGAALSHMTSLTPVLADAAAVLVEALKAGGTILVAGNGGSAAEAQHFAAELVGRFERDRAPYRAIALTTDSSIVTAVANDYGYEQVFARQVFALARPGDVLLAYSTSGESENLVRAAVAGRQAGLTVIAVTGRRASRLGRIADLCVPVPVVETAVAQELHMMVTHLLCSIVESELSGEQVR